jgi:hypothetical protein
LFRSADFAVERPSRGDCGCISFSARQPTGPPDRNVRGDDDVLKLSTRLTAAGLVTIVGAAGVGKTTVALAVGQHLIDAIAGALLFVDLSMLGAREMLSSVVHCNIIVRCTCIEAGCALRCMRVFGT